MYIRFLGAAQTVTGSQHLLEINGKKLMLDCGLYQGRRQQARERNQSFQFPIETLDAVILSHAHIDHSGNLPNLVKQGYAGPIHAQKASAHLSAIMLEDSGHIHEENVRHINRRRKRRGQELLEPLYTVEDAKQVADQFVHQDYDAPFGVLPGVQATFVEAGHILGSTAIVLDIDDGGDQKRFWFSGDIGRPDLPLIRDPVFPQETDYLLMECTYGDRPHPHPSVAYENLRNEVNETLQRGGKVIIPSFAVGRTQELVYDIHQMMDKGEVPKAPVFVDSPLAVNVTDIFRAHPECFDAKAVHMIESGEHRAALGFDMLTYVRSVEESKALNEREDPMIIISASGMVEVGRVLHHLEHNVHDPNSVVLIVSWMAPHTLGRRLAEKQKQIKIFGEVYERRIRVANVEGFSAHAGANLLAEYALGVKDSVKDVFLVHGEQRGADGLRERLAEGGMTDVHFPAWGTSAEL